MKLLTILSIALLIGGALAAEPKINPATQINWDKNVSAHIHGLTNGTLAQDAATYSQMMAATAATSDNTKLNKSGDTMTGAISWGTSLNGKIDLYNNSNTRYGMQINSTGQTQIYASSEALRKVAIGYINQPTGAFVETVSFSNAGGIDVNAKKITEVANGAAAQDAVTYSQLIDAAPAMSITVGPATDYNAKFYDFVTDGTDDRIQIQAAIDKAYGNEGTIYGGGLVELARGNYSLGAGTIDMWHGVTLRGATPISADPTTWGTFHDYKPYSWISITSTALPAFLLRSGAHIENLIFYYPNQKLTGTPDVYNATIALVPYHSDFTIRDCYAINPYVFINATAGHARLKVTDVCGGPLYRGIIEDACGDVSYFTRVHFHSSFSLGDASLLDWVQHNGYAFYIKTSDWVKLTNCFAYGYLGGLVALGTNDMKVVACGMDACIHPYYLTSTSKAVISSSYGTAYHNPGGLVAEYPTDGNCFELLGTGGENIISDNEMYASQSGVSITSTTNKNNTISDNSVHTFGIASTGNGFGIITYSTGNIISTNRINGRDNTNTFGIYINDASNNVVMGNSISDVSTAGILLTATVPAYVVVGNMCIGTVGGISNAAGGGNTTSQVMQHNVVA